MCHTRSGHLRRLHVLNRAFRHGSTFASSPRSHLHTATTCPPSRRLHGLAFSSPQRACRVASHQRTRRLPPAFNFCILRGPPRPASKDLTDHGPQPSMPIERTRLVRRKSSEEIQGNNEPEPERRTPDGDSSPQRGRSPSPPGGPSSAEPSASAQPIRGRGTAPPGAGRAATLPPVQAD